MVGEADSTTAADFLALVAGYRSAGTRSLVGLAGPPGSGKSHLAAYLSRSLSPAPPVVPLDGFHLAQAVIDTRGLADSKGAPETFDAWGFVNLLDRLADPAEDGVVYAPKFDRSIEEPIAGAIRIGPGDRLVLVEGNYLLLENPPWNRIRPALDMCGYLELDDETRVRRLVERHMRYGRTPLEAERFVRESDERNAELIKTTRDRADVVVEMDPS